MHLWTFFFPSERGTLSGKCFWLRRAFFKNLTCHLQLSHLQTPPCWNTPVELT
jgi:hypothetical protein